MTVPKAENELANDFCMSLFNRPAPKTALSELMKLRTEIGDRFAFSLSSGIKLFPKQLLKVDLKKRFKKGAMHETR